MKKNILIIIVVFIAIIFFFFFTTRDKPTTDKIIPPVADNEESVFRPNPSNATFIFDSDEITLSEGRSERPIATGSALIEEVVLMDKFAYGDVNSDGKEDTIVLLARYGGGSGSFIYLATYASGPVTYRGSRAYFIGDRVIPQSISVDRGIVTLEYLDRKTGEAFAVEPTILVSKQFIFKDGKFQER